jgi:hypothetical protein
VQLAARPSSAASLSFYYVSTGGSDDNPGTKIFPWRTIQHAANVVPDGSSIHVNSGIYEKRVSITRSGTAEKKIFFKSIPRRSLDMRGFDIKADHIRVEGFNIDPGIGEGFGVFIHSGNYIDVIDNYYMVNCKIGIFTRSRNIPGHLYISNNKMYRCNMGIMLFAHDSLIENNEVQRLVRSHGVDAIIRDFSITTT